MNTRFYIYSITGRNISIFSNYESEREVLFLPFSNFIVYKTEIVNNIHVIYLRQYEFGFSRKNILWVDDKIFDPDWENKKHMERAVSYYNNIRFIPKINTECALAYLKSPFG